MSNGALGDGGRLGVSWAVQEHEVIMIYQFKRFLREKTALPPPPASSKHTRMPAEGSQRRTVVDEDGKSTMAIATRRQ